MATQHSLRAGAAEVDITPEVGAALAGSLRRRVSDGVLDPLYARAVVFESGGIRMAIILLDVIVIGNEDAASARRNVGEVLGIPAEQVCICCTHTHSGPSTLEMFESPREKEFLTTRLIPGVENASRLALEQLRPARAAWANGWEPRAGFNRRHHMRDGSVKMNPGYENPDVVKVAGPTDPQIPMLLIESVSGEPIALIANFSLHYIGGFVGDVISADYFGQFAALMKESKGEKFVALLTHGASGDINNIDVSRRPPPREPGEQVRTVAGWMRDHALEAWEQAEFAEEVAVACNQRIHEQGVRKLVGREIDEAQEQWENESLDMVDRLYGRERLELLKWPDTVPMPVQAFRVGDFAAATMTGEIFCRFGLDLKNASPFSATALIELANGYGGYVPTRVDYDLGGYETWLARSAFASPGTGEALVVEAAKSLKELWSG